MEEVPTIEHVFLSLRDSGVGWSMHLWRAEGVRHNDCAKEINLEMHMYGETYIVWVIGRNVDGETTDRYRDGDAG